MLRFFLSEDLPKSSQVSKVLCLDRSRPWAYFDGACRDMDALVGLGFALYLSDTHVFHFKANDDRGTNNLGEFNSLFYLLKFALKSHVTSLQVKGDSLLTTNWMNGSVQVVNNSLYSLACELKRLVVQFQQINFQHLYREQNSEADGLDIG